MGVVMYKVKNAIETLNKLDPNEGIIFIYWTKDDLVRFAKDNQYSYLNSQDDEPISDSDLSKWIDDDCIADIDNDIGNNDYLWESINSTIDETLNHHINEAQKEITTAENETELWDTSTKK